MPKPTGKGSNKTPKSVQGSQGKAAPLKLDHFHNKPTHKKPFPQ